MVKIPLLSFFTGGGFFDIGFEKAGFIVHWTNEVNPTFADMHEYAMSKWRNVERTGEKPSTISCRNSIVDLKATTVIGSAFGAKPPRLFGIIGGPPCPDFSSGGRNGGGTGSTGKLTMVFANLIGQIAPTFFVMENVPGLIRTGKHRVYFDKVIRLLEVKYGFSIDFTLLNALAYGVPQDRDRLFIVGIKREWLEKLLERTPSLHERNWFTWPKPSYPHFRELPWPKRNPFGKVPAVPEGIPLELTVYPLLGGYDDPEKLPNGTEYFNPHSRKFWRRAEGDVSGKSFKRLHRYRYSPTAWYGNNEVHLHPWKPRRLSVREALRLQTVPDEYVLSPDASLSAKFKLICNGVPCVLSEHLAKALLDFLSPLCSQTKTSVVQKRTKNKKSEYISGGCL